MPIKSLQYLSHFTFAKKCICYELLKIHRPSIQFVKWTRQLSTTHSPSMKRYVDNRSHHNWKINLDDAAKGAAHNPMSLPMLVYVYSPWKYLTTKWNIWKLKLYWDKNFNESLFVENSKQAAVVITNVIRLHQAAKISKCSTPLGFQQISHDLLGNRADGRLQMLRFQPKHFHRAIPLKVKLLKHFDHRYAFIDMFFVGLRHTKDFSSVEERNEMDRLVDATQFKLGGPIDFSVPNPIIFAEIFIRFRRDYSQNAVAVQPATGVVGPQWLVSSYKILQFDILNYNPYTEARVF